MEYLSKNEDETYKIADEFVDNLKTQSLSKREAIVVGLYGELGAGKTTFMKEVAKNFGINETIQSPTFVIEKIYDIEKSKSQTLDFDHLIHIDAYRIEKSEELINLGWREIVANPKNIIFIEWPERVVDIMPEHVQIKFEHLNENENQRKITIK